MLSLPQSPWRTPNPWQKRRMRLQLWQRYNGNIQKKVSVFFCWDMLQEQVPVCHRATDGCHHCVTHMNILKTLFFLCPSVWEEGIFCWKTSTSNSAVGLKICHWSACSDSQGSAHHRAGGQKNKNVSPSSFTNWKTTRLWRRGKSWGRGPQSCRFKNHNECSSGSLGKKDKHQTNHWNPRNIYGKNCTVQHVCYDAFQRDVAILSEKLLWKLWEVV